MKEPEPQTADFGKGDFKTGKPKTRRVSSRKELAVVTLGMVAAVTGLGGILAANPPAGAASGADTGNETAAVIEPQPARDDGGASERDGPAIQEVASNQPSPRRELAAQAARQPEQPSIQTPSWSAPSPQQAPARSRGS